MPTDTLAPASAGDSPHGPLGNAERFRVLHLHAEGGLGAVWMAEDGDLKRHVALKEIRWQHADQPQNRARFLQEAEITGRLEHPGVVPVYALGQRADGRPYYVMRFIRGQSLREAIRGLHGKSHAAQSQQGSDQADAKGEFDPLTERQLLGRFVDVCEAVAYAHSRGVLHRDLKPDNVMLGAYGETLVVDWGLAKPAEQAEASGNPSALESQVLVSSGSATQLGSAIGTPGYMSPEQARGELDRLTPGTDVYSLGATLYCLLTGRTPIRNSDLAAALEATCTGNFLRPRDVRKEISRPLESIVMKAMALEPSDRYQDALELAQDVQSFLDDEPVLAHRDSTWERLGRWLRRHRSSVVAGSTALLLVAVISTVAATLIARSRDKALDLAEANANLADNERSAREAAESASQLAEKQKARAEKYYSLAIGTVDDFLTGVSDDDRLRAFGLEGLRRDLLVQASEFYKLVIQQAEEGEDPLYERRANALQRLGEIHYEVGDYDASVTAYQQLLQLFDEMGPEQVKTVDYFVAVNDIARTFYASGDHESARQLWETQIQGLQAAVQTDPDAANYYNLLATGQLNVAMLISDRSIGESIAMSKAALESVGHALRLQPEDVDIQSTKALIHNNLGNDLLAKEEVDLAAEHLHQAQQYWESMRAEAEGWYADFLDDHLALVYVNLAIVDAQRGDNDGAAQRIEEGLALRRQIAERHPETVHLRSRLAELLQLAAVHYRTLTRYNDSLRVAAEALEILGRLHQERPSVPSYQAAMAEIYSDKAMTHVSTGELTAALESLSQSKQLAESLVELDPERFEYRWRLAVSLYYQALGFIDAAEPEKAYQAFASAVQTLEKLQEQRPEDAEVLNILSDSEGTLADLTDETLLNRPLESQLWRHRALATVNRMLDPKLADRLNPSMRRDALINRAESMTGLERFDEALADWDRVIELDGGKLDYETGVGKGVALFAAGRLDEALQMGRRTAEAMEHPALVFNIAREFSLGVVALNELDLSAEERSEWRDRFAATAIELLELAAERGYFENQEAVDFLTEDAYLEPLQDREEFLNLLQRLK